MDAKVGDMLVIRGHRTDEPDRTAEIVEVHGETGHPPYVVRWEDGHQSLIFPGPGALVQQHS